MKLISLNGWGGKLHDPLIAYLAAEVPDILCLQEVVHTPASDQEWLTYRDGEHILPQRANMLQDIAATLPDHHLHFCPAAQGVLWDGDRSLPSQWGLATLVRRSLPIIGQIQGFVYKSFSPHGYGEHPRQRVAHGIRVYDYTADRALSVTHMHGMWDPRGKADTPERASQAKNLLDIAHQVQDPEDIAVICGDFNVLPDSETLAMLKRAGFTELVTEGGFEGTRTSHYKKPGRFADYLAINRREAVHRFDVVTSPEVSDHCPLLLEL